MTIRKHDEIPVSGIVLNPENFRHRPAVSQEQALGFLFGDDIKRAEMLALATDIAARGLDQSNLLIVEPADGYWRVLEGNRRVAAMKVMANPDLLPDLDGLSDTAMTAYRTKFAELGGSAVLPSSVLCFVTDDRELADHLITLKHTGVGTHKGAGTVLWDSEGRTRHELATSATGGKKATAANKQTAAALALLDALEVHFAGDADMAALILAARKKGLTTLGRLLGNAANQLRLGVRVDGTSVRFGANRPAIRLVMERVLGDLGTPQLNSRTTNKAADVTEYLDRISGDLPAKKDRLTEAEAPTAPSPTETSGTSANKKGRRKQAPIMHRPFVGLDLNHASDKTRSFLAEIKKLRIEDYPYTLACSIRTLIDLYTADVQRVLQPDNVEESPSKRARQCLRLLDPDGTKPKDRRFPRIGDALADHTGDLSIDTMNGFMHRPHHNPTADTIRKQVAEYQPWLSALDDHVEDHLSAADPPTG